MFKANQKLPPALYLRQVLEHCPRAGQTYCILWDNMDKNNHSKFNKDDIRTVYLYSMKSWRDHLRLLAKEGLINIDEDKENFDIELVGYDMDEEISSACY